MKGVIFTEFLDMVESSDGMELADRVLTKVCPGEVGFTSVGTYDYQIMIRLIMEYSDAVDKPTRDVIRNFGKYLFHRLRAVYPTSTVDVSNSIEQILKVENVIHEEVTKLYPDAELPHFTFPQSADGVFQIEYLSARPFADLAEGLIAACIEHFKDDFVIERSDLPGAAGTHALFCLRPRSQAT